jgi:uncharacterized membrane protein YkvA (DUF1232 family)
MRVPGIDGGFVRDGGARMGEDDVRRVVENADAIGAKLGAAGAFGRLLGDAKLLISLVRDYWNKEYRAVPYWVVGAAVFALLYVLTPLDLIPDPIPVVGYLDDAAVVSACLAMVRQELAKYAEWKRTRERPTPPKD